MDVYSSCGTWQKDLVNVGSQHMPPPLQSRPHMDFSGQHFSTSTDIGHGFILPSVSHHPPSHLSGSSLHTSLNHPMTSFYPQKQYSPYKLPPDLPPEVLESLMVAQLHQNSKYCQLQHKYKDLCEVLTSDAKRDLVEPHIMQTHPTVQDIWQVCCISLLNYSSLSQGLLPWPGWVITPTNIGQRCPLPSMRQTVERFHSKNTKKLQRPQKSLWRNSTRMLTQIPVLFCMSPHPRPRCYLWNGSWMSSIKPSSILELKKPFFACVWLIGKPKWWSCWYCRIRMRDSEGHLQVPLLLTLLMWMVSSSRNLVKPHQSHLLLVWHHQVWQNVPSNSVLVPSLLQHCTLKNAAKMVCVQYLWTFKPTELELTHSASTPHSTQGNPFSQSHWHSQLGNYTNKNAPHLCWSLWYVPSHLHLTITDFWIHSW